MRPVSSLQGFADLLRACSAIARSESSLSLDPITAFEGSRRFGRRLGWAWNKTALSQIGVVPTEVAGS